MTLLRSERFPAVLLLAAAALGLLIANLPVGPAVLHASEMHLTLPWADLSLSHWVSDGLLAIFFFGVAVELQYELTSGELSSVRKAIQPAIAAAGGVLVPILIYLLIAGADPATRDGWPIATATDIAFALGVLAVFGRGLPSPVRVFLLALAIIDDLVGIVLIAVLFATDLDLGLLAIAVVLVVVFGALSRVEPAHRGARIAVIALMIVLAVAAWLLVLQSGVHATIAGVLLGFAVRQGAGLRTRHVLEPWINGAILPLFAFVAALVVIPQVSPSELSPALWAVWIALPVGKLIGIVVFGWLALRIRPRGVARAEHTPILNLADLIAAGALGGVGFTVSLLLAKLAFAEDPAIRDQSILGVLGGSLTALVVCAVVVSLRARHYRLIAASS